MDGSSAASKVDFRVGKDAPLGQALRRYWIPACLSADLPAPDSDPIRLRLLGEPLVAFRDSSGAVGVLDEHCPHRRASLAYGRNEKGGLRCLWHQWKFDVHGKLLETPNSADCTLKERVSANAYAVRESGGLVWTFLGDADQAPPFHEFGWAKVRESHRVLAAIDLDCNFSKGIESLMDSSHVSLLHEDSMRKSARFRSTISSDAGSGAIDSAPSLRVEETDFGFHYVSLRETTPEKTQARLSVFVAPYLCFVAPQDTAFLSVPIDDQRTRLFLIAWSAKIPITPALRADWIRFMGIDPSILDACGMTPRAAENGVSRQNAFRQDRAAMKAGASYSGLPGLMAEDAAMITSIPGISDYAGEHLTASDAAVVLLRRILWRMARSHDGSDRSLPGVASAFQAASLNSASGVLANPESWRSIVPYLEPATGGATASSPVAL